MRELLQSRGFLMTDKCACGGSILESWYQPTMRLTVEIRPTRDSFRIVLVDRTVRGDGKELVGVLKQIEVERSKEGAAHAGAKR